MGVSIGKGGVGIGSGSLSSASLRGSGSSSRLSGSKSASVLNSVTRELNIIKIKCTGIKNRAVKNLKNRLGGVASVPKTTQNLLRGFVSNSEVQSEVKNLGSKFRYKKEKIINTGSQVFRKAGGTLKDAGRGIKTGGEKLKESVRRRKEKADVHLEDVRDEVIDDHADASGLEVSARVLGKLAKTNIRRAGEILKDAGRGIKTGGKELKESVHRRKEKANVHLEDVRDEVIGDHVGASGLEVSARVLGRLAKTNIRGAGEILKDAGNGIKGGVVNLLNEKPHFDRFKKKDGDHVSDAVKHTVKYTSKEEKVQIIGGSGDEDT